jgi:GT2 family glycosyltransferase
LLASLSRLQYPREYLQVVVAVDGPDPDLESVARKWADEVIVLPQNRGSYAARNAAIEAIAHDVHAVLFTDADAEVTPGWITGHLAALDRCDISAGHVQVTYRDDQPTVAELVDSVRFLDQRRLAEGLGHAATANMAVRPLVLRSVRFNPGLRSGGDREFGARARALGYQVSYTADAVVTHPARYSAPALIRKVVRVGRGIALMNRLGLLSSPTQPYRRPPAVRIARQKFPQAGTLWLAAVRLLDVTCSIVWTMAAPGSVAPALRRRFSNHRLRL